MANIVRQTDGWQLQAEQWLPAGIAEVFEFFGNAENLETLTPPWLHFRILTPLPVMMQPGTLIDYRLRLRGIPLRWRTEITCWEPPFRFVDSQLRGPYRRWIHTHTFHLQNGGTLVRDEVDYLSPGGLLVHRWWVNPELLRIFEYRAQRLAERFAPESMPFSTM